jgi:hypothetical protein
MDLDEQHRQYFEKNPNGNHPRMSSETARVIDAFRKDFKKHTADDLREFSKITDTLTDIKVNISELAGMIKANGIMLTNVHEQTVKTNGRVSSLEKENLRIDRTIHRWKGGLIVGMVLLGAFWSFITFVYPLFAEHQSVVVTIEE